MENLTDALKMAAAMLIFVIALSITIISFSKARIASSSILSKSSEDIGYYDNSDGYATQKLVGVESVITNLYEYRTSGDTILFYKGSYNNTNNELSGIEKVPIYCSECAEANLSKSILKIDNGRQIYGVDINDEISRNEFWLHDSTSTKDFIDCLVQRIPTAEYSFSKLTSLNPASNIVSNRKIKIGFVYDFDGMKTPLVDLNGMFVERIGEYNYETVAKSNSQSTVPDSGEFSGTVSSSTSSSKITFDNNETIDNEQGTRKRVIQYIYVGRI